YLMRLDPSDNDVVDGRKKDLTNRGGEKISAEEIENLILSHPAVQNVACVPVPDPNLGEKMCACLVLKRGQRLEFAELVEFLKTKEIAKFKLPERMLVVDDFAGIHVRQGVEESASGDGHACESLICIAIPAPRS